MDQVWLYSSVRLVQCKFLSGLSDLDKPFLLSGYQEKFYFNPGDTGFKVNIIEYLYKIYHLAKQDVRTVAVAVIVIIRNFFSKTTFVDAGLQNQVCNNWCW